LSITAIVGTMILVLTGGPADAHNHKSDKINIASFAGSFANMGSIVFAFGYSAAVFHGYTALVPKTPETFSWIARATTALGVTMCFLVGLVGYLSFRDSTDTDILENFTGVAGIVFKVIVIFHLIFYIPGDFVIMRYSIFKLFGADAVKADDSVYFLTTFLTLGGATLLACLLQIVESSSESLSLVLDLTGGISGSLLSFILPGVIALNILHENTVLYYKAIALTILGSVIPVLVIASKLSNY
jgi:sodium-coupled neutral amino acid transporter 11